MLKDADDTCCDLFNPVISFYDLYIYYIHGPNSSCLKKKSINMAPKSRSKPKNTMKKLLYSKVLFRISLDLQGKGLKIRQEKFLPHVEVAVRSCSEILAQDNKIGDKV